ncbi:MAG: hypothetical protein L0H96_13980 [Humibacillus sp.]|nr:hypothetical protein [Humibacillus sp.]MDN5778006.1 hypothetical protein [Humibacillus sp.]
MRTATSTTFTALIAALVLAACGATDETSAGTDRDPSGAASAPSTSTSAAETPAPSTTTTDAPTQSSPSRPGAGPVEPSAPSVSKLVFTVGGKKQDVTPTEVYCSGKEGTIRHVIGKTNQRPPLVEADGKNFVLVKVGNGQPFKAQSPAGVSYTKSAVTFDQVDVGGGVLSGTMACTTFES